MNCPYGNCPYENWPYGSVRVTAPPAKKIRFGQKFRSATVFQRRMLHNHKKLSVIFEWAMNDPMQLNNIGLIHLGMKLKTVGAIHELPIQEVPLLDFWEQNRLEL